MTAGAFNLFAHPVCADTGIIWFTSSTVHEKWISELEVLVQGGLNQYITK